MGAAWVGWAGLTKAHEDPGELAFWRACLCFHHQHSVLLLPRSLATPASRL